MAIWTFPLKSINGSNMYSDKDFRRFYANIFSSGIIPNVDLEGNLSLQVLQTEIPSMSIRVGPGVDMINGGHIMNTNFKSFSVPAPLTTQKRIDCIVVQWNESTNSGDIIYKKNTTQVIRSQNIWEHKLAEIVVPANATSISQANIKDTRAEPEVCGYSSPFKQINVGDLAAQLRALTDSYSVEFQEWFQNLKDQLDDNQAGNLQNQIDALNGKVYTAYANSADGSEDFTPVYPNLNLEKHTAQLIGKGNKLIWGSFGNKTKTIAYEEITIPGVPSLTTGIRMTQVTAGQSGWRGPSGSQGGSYAVTPGGKYTHSVYIKNNANIDLTVNLQLGTCSKETDQTSNTKYVKGQVIVPANSDWKLYSAVITIPSDNSWAWSYVYTDNPTVTADYTIAGLKVEAGEVLTPWMPHESEVKPSDYPQYMYKGMFANLHNSDRNNPANYNWVRNTDVIRDESGAMIIDRVVSLSDTPKIPLEISSGWQANAHHARMKNGVLSIYIQGIRPKKDGFTGESYPVVATLPKELRGMVNDHDIPFMWSNYQGGGTTYAGRVEKLTGKITLYLMPNTNKINSNHRFSVYIPYIPV